jgi:DNA processing protein
MKFLNALNKINGVGSQKMRLLLNFFKSSENIWKSNLSDLIQSGIGEDLAEKIVAGREKLNPEKEWEWMEKENVRMLTVEDKNYPNLLREIPNPPYILYVKGEFDCNSAPLVAIVGSRKFSSYGKQAAYSFARELTQAGVIVVSGMAFGIDSVAHLGAMEAGGKTIAVLGNSLESAAIYPRANLDLSKKIVNNGLLVSEYPVGTTMQKGTFPARNRIMAGMTLGTLVVEAAKESGSLITANLALEFNREVFSIPGPIFVESSEGTNELIKKGAKLVTNAKEILEELNLEKVEQIRKAREIIPATKEEEIVLKILSAEPTHIDNIIKLTKLKTAAISSTLIMMEMKGMIKNIGGQNYIIL